MDSELRIRVATESDAARVVDLVDSDRDLQQVSPQDEPPLDASSVSAWMERAITSVVLERHGSVIAFATLVPDARDEKKLWIGHVVLAPHERGLGLGVRFVRGLLQLARRWSRVREVRLSVFAENEAALRCYHRSGFEAADERREDGRRLLEMRWLNPDQDRRIRRPVAAVIALIATGISAMLLPWGARFWLLEYQPSSVGIMLAAAALFAAGWAWIGQPILPPRSAPLSHRLGRPVIFGAAVGLGTVLSGWLAMMVGWGVGAMHLPRPASALLEQLVAEGLRHGTAWGLVLLVALDLAPHALGWRRPSGRGGTPRRQVV